MPFLRNEGSNLRGGDEEAQARPVQKRISALAAFGFEVFGDDRTKANASDERCR